MNILLLMAHSIAEYDDLRMFADLGYDVFSIGAYTDPRHPGDDKRPALTHVPRHPELAKLVAGDQMAHKAYVPHEVLEWADVVICHHYPEQWLMAQWPRFKKHGCRVIWRTCGQSDPRLEQSMATLRPLGLEIVRYSPRERLFFEKAGAFAGEDALIRFGKYVDEWQGWTGDVRVIGNITQNMPGRGDHTGYGYWQAATASLPVQPAGPGSEAMLGGRGSMTYDEMRQYLRDIRCYLYTGTVPASYTLGLIEAMLTGTPVISIDGDSWHGPSLLLEAPELCSGGARPIEARDQLRTLLYDHDLARVRGQRLQARARALFDVEAVGRQWVAYLGAPAAVAPQARPSAAVPA